jgi:hypothetical protein
MTVVFVTHSINEAAFLADRAIVFTRRPAGSSSIMVSIFRSSASQSCAATPTFARESAVLLDALRRGGTSRESLPAHRPPAAARADRPHPHDRGMGRNHEQARRTWCRAQRPLGRIVDNRAELWGSMLTTARGALIGFATSVVGGIVIAVVLSTSKLIQRAFYPYTVFFQTVPVVAIAPLLVIWYGAGFNRSGGARSSSRSSPSSRTH